MKRSILLLFAIICVVSGASAHNPKAWRKLKSDVNIFVVSDAGREGCYDQQLFANLMGEMAKRIKPMCIVTTGDNHHGNGVKSVHDNDWKQNFEDIYTHSKLQIDWYPALGNHEYQGNPQAVIDYSKVNSCWNMPARYYTKVINAKGTSIRFIIIDTSPLIKRYHNNHKYPDIDEQNYEQQMEWLNSVLSNAKEDWVIVAGHHPIHAHTNKSRSERVDMRNSVDKTLRQHKNVSIYICGHIHNFQHLRDKNSHIDYIVNSSAAKSRSVDDTKRTVYCSPETGFSVISANENVLTLHMIDKNGNILHSVNKRK